MTTGLYVRGTCKVKHIRNKGGVHWQTRTRRSCNLWRFGTSRRSKLKCCRFAMVGLKEVQAALNAPGLVTTSPLSFNQLKVELAKKLHIQADDEVFTEHKQVQVFADVCKPRAAAPAPAKKSAPPPKNIPKSSRPRQPVVELPSRDKYTPLHEL